MKAIVLAAGESRRMAPVTRERPKCLLDVCGKSLLAHQLDAFRDHGLEEVVVVAGYHEEMVGQACAGRARTIINPIFRTTNSIYSLWLAREAAAGGFVLANGDVLFHPGLLERLLSSQHEDALVISFGEALAEEEMKVRVEGDRILDINKTMDPEKADGENVGLLKFGPEGAAVLIEKLEELISEGLTDKWAPYAFRAILDRRPLYAVSTAGLPWIEIDFAEDLEMARRTIGPAIASTVGPWPGQ